jgi:glycosyltransferase involved in cell wall biosynthesis
VRAKKIVVVTSSPAATDGGHLIIGRALVQALAESGHDASLLVTPDYGFGRNVSTYWANWQTEVGRADQVISLRYPSYAIRHHPHVCWLNHTIREYYDLWPRFSATLSTANRVKERIRRAGLHTVDRWLLTRNVDQVVAQSATVQKRLASDFGIAANVVWPPAPQRPYRCDDYGDYVFTVSRLVPPKRVDLLVRALAEPVALSVRAVIAGDGECRPSLERLASSLGVANRIEFTGHLPESELIGHLARCRAVSFTPLQEDYGFVTVEAFAASKAVITCRDSGGPAELVDDGVTGLLADPTPDSLAAALARASNDTGLAQRMGAAAKTRASALTWQDAVGRLLMVNG